MLRFYYATTSVPFSETGNLSVAFVTDEIVFAGLTPSSIYKEDTLL